MLDPTYTIDVPGIGTFVFKRRTLRTQMRIEAEAHRVLGGPTEDKELRHFALAFGTLVVLTETPPEGWDVESLDPLDATSSAKLWIVYGALRSAEDTFRSGGKPAGA